MLGGCEDLAQARLTFANGCIADLSASRVHPVPVRRMQIWSAEGFVGVDFAHRKLSLMQPAEHLRQGRIDSRRLDAGTAASLKAELFGRHLQMREMDCEAGDQLTRELQDFIRCVRTGARPRVDGRAGRDAVALACRILDSMTAHRWDGRGRRAGWPASAAGAVRDAVHERSSRGGVIPYGDGSSSPGAVNSPLAAALCWPHEFLFTIPIPSGWNNASAVVFRSPGLGRARSTEPLPWRSPPIAI